MGHYRSDRKIAAAFSLLFVSILSLATGQAETLPTLTPKTSTERAVVEQIQRGN
jgi:hypothetical protein